MDFKNTAQNDLDFSIEGVRYQVPAGGRCELPDRLAFYPAAVGIPLKRTGAVPVAKAVEIVPLPAAPADDAPAVPYTPEELAGLNDDQFQVPKNASRKVLHETCDRFALPRPPADLSNKDLAKALALKLDEIKQRRGKVEG